MGCKDPAAARGLFNQSESSHCAASPSGDDGGWTEAQLPQKISPEKVIHTVYLLLFPEPKIKIKPSEIYLVAQRIFFPQK